MDIKICCKVHISQVLDRLCSKYELKMLSRETAPIYQSIIGKNPVEVGLQHMDNEGLYIKDHLRGQLLAAIIAKDTDLLFKRFDELSYTTKEILDEGAILPIKRYFVQHDEASEVCPLKRKLQRFANDFQFTENERKLIQLSCVMKYMENFFETLPDDGCWDPVDDPFDREYLEAALQLSEKDVEDLMEDGRLFRNSIIDSNDLIINSHFEELILARSEEDEDYEDYDD